MRWKKVMKDHLIAKTRSTSDLPTSNNGDLSERIGARLHDLSQLQLESGKRSHLSRANISKSSSSVIGNRSYHSDHGPSRRRPGNDFRTSSNACPLHPNIDPQSYDTQALSISTSSNFCNCEGDVCNSLMRTRSSPPASSECTQASSNHPNHEPYFFDRRWRNCKCATHLRPHSGIEITELEDNVSNRLYHNGLQYRRSFAHPTRERHHGDNFHLKRSNYPSQYYPDLSPLEMCNLLQGMQEEDGEPDDNDRLELDEETAHFINTLTIRDVQLLLLQENYTNVPRNKTLQGSNDKQYMSRRMQNRKENSVHNSDDNFRVSEDRLARIANWHHLPRVTMDRAKLMRSVSNDHIPTRLGNSIQVGYPHFRHAKKVNRFVKRSESVQQESSSSTKCKTPGADSTHGTNSTSANNLGRHHSSSKDNMYGLNIKTGRSFLAQNKKVTSQLLPIATARELKEKQKERELNLTLSSENNSGETDNYEDSSSNSLPDSIEGEGLSCSDRKGIKTFPFGLQKSSHSIDEEDEIAIKLMHEEDLSFQLLQDADTVHKYVASRGQREKEEDIYEVFPPTITVRHRSTRIIRHR